MRWINALLVFAIFLSTALAAICPPSLHVKCKCSVDPESRVVVVCANVSASLVFASLQNDSIHSLLMTECAIPSLDSPLPLRDLETLEMTNCSIENISPDVLAPVKDTVKTVLLGGNRLTVVPPFRDLPKLTSLNLNSNRITDVPAGALLGMPNLEELRIEDNQICLFSGNAFEESKKSLQLLDISHNCLLFVPSQLKDSPKLKYLDLSSNKIGEIGTLAFMNMPVLKEVRLNDNAITSVAPMCFHNVPDLQLLYLRHNRIGIVDGLRLQTKKLEVLDARNNAMKWLPSYKELPNLKHLLLDGNSIPTVDSGAFAGNPMLEMLSIQQTGLVSIDRTAFDGLNELQYLLLANNSLRSVDGVLVGMKKLENLNLKNNSLTAITNATFAGVPKLTSVDLSYNKITRIAPASFTKQEKLFWLDLAHNQLRTFEQGSFDRRVNHILLEGNPLECDSALDWFVRYLVMDRVRTSLPNQADITCSGPEKYRNVTLKELMMKKANETITTSINTLGLNTDMQGSQRSMLANFFPGLSSVPGIGGGGGAMGGAAALPILGSLGQSIPALRNLPLFNVDPNEARTAADTNAAIEQFAGPLVRFATGGQPVAADLEQLLKAIPNLVNVPGYGSVDISKLPPEMIAHVLRGGQIPGVPKETLDNIIRTHMQKMAEVAEQIRLGNKPDGYEKFLPPLEKLPSEMISSVMGGATLPGLNETQTEAIKSYYAQQVTSASELPAALPANPLLSPAALEMMKILPPGYNLSRIPPEIIAAASRGEVPDLNLLPQDLQDHLKTQVDKLLSMFGGGKTNVSIESLLKKLPKWDRPVLPTFSPYDINGVNTELVLEEELRAKSARMWLYTGIALGVIGLVTLGVVITLCVILRRSHAVAPSDRSILVNSLLGPPQNSSSPKTRRDASAASKMSPQAFLAPNQSSQLHFHDA